MTKDTSKNMFDIMKSGVVWGASQSVVGSVPTSSALGTTTKGFAQAGMSIMYIKDINKKIKM